MYLHVGGGQVVPIKEIVVIMNRETMAKSENNKNFIETSAEEGFIQKVASDGEINSWVITTRKVIASPISAPTLVKRIEQVMSSGIIG
ncbi:MAG TPA: DUF370 domain-containing protein [Firmicutes bacterium]|nr:DUF370 domain-containing protein [Bacillota bacterium]